MFKQFQQYLLTYTYILPVKIRISGIVMDGSQTQLTKGIITLTETCMTIDQRGLCSNISNKKITLIDIYNVFFAGGT